MTIAEKLSTLRTIMDQNGLDAFIIPSSDPHQSEYVADHWKSREWISGFTGSAGTVVVTKDHAGLWTDSRYFLQAEQELSDSEFVLHKQYDQFAPAYVSWLVEHLSGGQTVGIDGWCFSISQANYYKKLLDEKSIDLSTKLDIISKSWTNRPDLPDNKVFDHEIKFCGKSREEKIADIRNHLTEKKCDHHLVTTLDDIAWIFNIRSNDVDFNPVAIAYTIISKDEVKLFINPAKIDDDISSKLNQAGVSVHPYQSIINALADINGNILIDKGSCNSILYNTINANIINGEMPSRHMKAIKNAVEIENLKKVMIKDGVALAKTFYWLEQNIENNVSEYDLSGKLAHFRSQEDDYFGESFSAIVGYKGNGAIIHYSPMPDTSATIKPEGILLVDSGGQYFDGTTDITRTFTLSDPTEEQKDAYTRVLKGHIGLAKVVFPEGTLGVQLDILARQSLWEGGLNYLHGTGHGVGFFLNVHEPPQGFTPGLSGRSKTKHLEGMYTSNEPGYYKEGEFGIRIENLVIAVKTENEGFLKHDTITLYPIDQKLIKHSLLTKEEILWINDYHEEVYKKLSPHLDEEHTNWLKKQCVPIEIY